MALITNKADIWDIDDLGTEEIRVPEWDKNGNEVSVLIRTLSAAQRDKFESSILAQGDSKKPNLKNFRARYVAQVVVDENGNRLFTDADAEKLGTKSAKAVDRIYSAAQKLNAMSNDDVKELVEDFDETPDENSTSA